MTLIYCRECGKKYSDQASACPECACPSEVTSPQVSVLPDDSAADRCSSCGSTSLQRYSFVHAQGTSGSSGSVFGIGSGSDGGIASARVKASSLSVSGLAALTAPPEKREREPLALWKTICLVVFYPAGILYYFFVHRPALAHWKQGESARSSRFRKAHLDYKLQWLCMDCGTTNKFQIESNGTDADHPDAGDGAQQPSTPAPTGNTDPQANDDEAKARKRDIRARERKYKAEPRQAKQKRASKWTVGCLVFLVLAVLGQLFQAAGIGGGGSSLPAHVSLMNKELGRGRKYLGVLSGNDLAQQISEAEADVSQAKREGWCITAAGCRDGYVCGLPNAIGLTTGYTEEFTGPMGVRRAAQGGSRIKENTIIAHICSTPYCLKETKAEYRSMINRMKQGNNVTIHGPEFRVWDL